MEGPLRLEADGRRLEAFWAGPGPAEAPTLVFLHEGLGSAGQWRDVPARLAAAAGCGALVYSRAGYGASDPLPPPWPVEFMHREALVTLPAVLDALEIERPVLVGHSDGGSIALIYAGGPGAGSDRLLGLALEAPHVFVEDVTVESIAALPAQEGLRDRLRRHHGANTDPVFQAWTDVWLRPEFREWNITEVLPRVACPVLVIQGEDDPYGTVAQVDAILSGVASPVETLLLPGCGHTPHREKPEETLRAMVGFARRVAATREESSRSPSG
jgi:pimeloyl-ACP methyl ester carboxylesterase